MRPIDADEALKIFDNDLETMKAKIEGKVPFQVGAAMVSAAKEIRVSLKETLDKTPTLDLAPKWISVNERLPETTDVYLVNAMHRYNKNDGYRSPQIRLYFKDDNEWQGLPDLYEVTHWMPLPKPPKEDEKND